MASNDDTSSEESTLHVGYKVDRIVGLTGFSMLLLLFCYQIGRYFHTAQKEPVMKIQIFAACALCCSVMIAYSADSANLFLGYPMFAWYILYDLGVSIFSGVYCLVIYSHFKFYYYTRRTPVPRFVGSGLFLNWILFVTTIITADQMAVALNRLWLDIVWETAAIIHVIIQVIIDVRGYLLLRRQVEASPLSKTIDMARNLSRIRNFHILINLSFIGYTSTSPYLIYEDVFVYGLDAEWGGYDPTDYHPDWEIYWFLVGLTTFLWWSWMRDLDDDEGFEQTVSSRTPNPSISVSRKLTNPRPLRVGAAVELSQLGQPGQPGQPGSPSMSSRHISQIEVHKSPVTTELEDVNEHDISHHSSVSGREDSLLATLPRARFGSTDRNASPGNSTRSDLEPFTGVLLSPSAHNTAILQVVSEDSERQGVLFREEAALAVDRLLEGLTSSVISSSTSESLVVTARNEDQD